MSKKIQKWQAVVASFLATGTLYTGMVVPAHAEGERVTNKGKIDLTQFFDEQEKGSNLDDEDPGKREDWFYGQRFGDGNQPDPVARVIALSQAQSLGQYKVKESAINSAGAKPVVPTVPTWKNIGPSPITNEYWTHGSVSGRVTSMSLAPNGNIYIGSAGGGVWVSKNAGQTWSSLTDGQVTLAIGSVAVAKDSKTIYAGTGENSLSLGSDAFYGEGLLVSTDAGTTWQNLHRDLFSGERITSVVVAPSNTQKIFFGSTIGLFQSNDGGKTLTSGNVGIALPDGNGGTITKYQVTSVVQDQKDPNKLFVAVAGHGIYKTTDGGTTWNLLGNGLPTAPLEIGNTALAIAPSNSNYIYASVTNQDPSDMGALTGLYVSKDGGAHWSQLTSTPDFTTQAAYYLDGDYSQGWYDNAITVSPTDPNTVIAAGIGIIKTTDGGKTWKNIVDRNSGIHPDEHAVLFDSSGNLLIGNDGGVFEIMKNGTKKNLNSNLVLTQDYPGMSIFNNGQQVLTGAQDNGSQIYYGPSAWRSVWTGDGAQTLSDPTDPNTMYVSYVNGDLYKTTNGGWNLFTDWNYVAAPVKSAEWVAPLAMDPSDHNTIYEGGENVYKSTDGADSWTKVTNHDKNDTNVTDGTGKEYNVTTIAVAPSNHNVVYAGYGNGYLEMSADGGATWTSIGKDGNVWSDPSVARNNWITGITVDPQNPYNVYVTQSGYRPLHYKSQGHVWHTTDASVSTPDWTDLSGTPDAGGLPNAPVNGLALNNGQLVAASDVGVFVSNGDNNWVNLGTGLPTVEVVDVKVAGGVVFAATHGRGTWELSLTQGQNTPASVSITTKDVPVATATSIVGRVVDKDNNPVANAVVDLYDGIKKIDTETTSYDGNFTSSNFVKSGKVGQSFNVTAKVVSTKLTTTQSVKITTAPVANISMNVVKQATAGSTFNITGHATDRYGNPVTNASLDLYIDYDDWTIVQTDDKGNYSFDIVAPEELKDEDGNWQNQVTFWVAWQQNEGVISKPQVVTFVPDVATSISLNASTATAHVKYEVGLSGVLGKDQYGNDVSNVEVALYENGKYWKTVTADAKGAFKASFTPVGAGTYTFKAVVKNSNPEISSSNVVVTVTK